MEARREYDRGDGPPGNPDPLVEEAFRQGLVHGRHLGEEGVRGSEEWWPRTGRGGGRGRR